MSRSNPLLWPKPPVIWNYGIAVLSVTAALIIARWPASHLQDAQVSLFLCAVMVSAWFGGGRPGLLAAALSALAFDYYFLPPIYTLSIKAGEVPRLIAFGVSALFVGSLSAAQRSATESLRRSRDDLNGTLQDLQRTNMALEAESRERKRAEEALRRAQAGGRGFASGAGGPRTRQPGDQHGRADCFPGTRNKSTDFGGCHQCQCLYPLVSGRRPQSRQGARGRHEDRAGRNAGGGNHQPDSPAFPEEYSAMGVGRCQRSHSRDDRLAERRGRAILHLRADGTGGRSSPGHGRSRAIAAGHDEPRDEQRGCDEGCGRDARARHHSRSARKTANFSCPSAIPAWGYPRIRRIRSSMRSLPRSPKGPEWDCGSAGPSWNRMEAACGLLTTLPAAQVFTLHYPPRSRHRDDTIAPTT